MRSFGRKLKVGQLAWSFPWQQDQSWNATIDPTKNDCSFVKRHRMKCKTSQNELTLFHFLQEVARQKARSFPSSFCSLSFALQTKWNIFVSLNVGFSDALLSASWPKASPLHNVLVMDVLINKDWTLHACHHINDT